MDEPSHGCGEEVPPKRGRLTSEGRSLIEMPSRGDPVLVVSKADGDTGLDVEVMPVLGVEEASMAEG